MIDKSLYYINKTIKEWFLVLDNLHYKLRKSSKTKIQTIGTIKNLAVLYNIPLDSTKNGIWKDGFTEALKILKETYTITMLNYADTKPSTDVLNSFDFVIVKSNWNQVIDHYLRNDIKGLTVPMGLMISGNATPPSLREMEFYDVLWYETEWYKNQIDQHWNIHHAFGIDTTTMFEEKQEKIYDWLSIGGLWSYKRLDRFVQNEGRKLIIGDTKTKSAETVLKTLPLDKVEIIDFVPYDQLRNYVNKSKNVHIAAGIIGGGERAVLEARACNVPVKIENDNPKLQELLESPIWDHKYYAAQLSKGIQSLQAPIQK